MSAIRPPPRLLTSLLLAIGVHVMVLAAGVWLDVAVPPRLSTPSIAVTLVSSAPASRAGSASSASAMPPAVEPGRAEPSRAAERVPARSASTQSMSTGALAGASASPPLPSLPRLSSPPTSTSTSILAPAVSVSHEDNAQLPVSGATSSAAATSTAVAVDAAFAPVAGHSQEERSSRENGELTTPGPAGAWTPPGFDSALPANPRPAYPLGSRWAGEQGTVYLDLYVNADGHVGDVRLVRSSGYRRLDESALTAVRRWVFRPARRNGEATAAWMSYSMGFNLRD
ncbi:MAG TPA: energy transducer TonB [Moraxellaceae bacterium]|nr:energy transducer TonB [Moraxellaceae bacterium]